MSYVVTGIFLWYPSCLQSLQKPVVNVLHPKTTNHSGLLLVGLTFISSHHRIAPVSLASDVKTTGTLALRSLFKKYT